MFLEYNRGFEMYSLVFWCVMCMAGEEPIALEHRAWPATEKLPKSKSLPPLLQTFDGRKTSSREDWNSIRKPELQSLVQHYMYGYIPPPRPVRLQLLFEDRASQGGTVWLREFRLDVTGAEDRPIHLLIALPAAAERKPTPIFLGLSFEGNQAVVDDRRVHLPTGWMYDRQPGVEKNRATEASRGTAKGAWPIDAIVARGYGLALAYCGDWEPDVVGQRGGLHSKITAVGPTGAHWGRIALWSWGLSRMLDATSSLPEIDAKRISVVGHSRLGKTALLAAALDDRFALSISNQSGCGGAAPSRGAVGESVARINTAFPNWFCENFKKFNQATDQLPFDQHALVALCAPRPVLLSNAEKDTWANPMGQFEVLVAAEPAYALFGDNMLSARSPPAIGKQMESRLGYYIRPGLHSMTRLDWAAYLDFADRHLKPK